MAMPSGLEPKESQSIYWQCGRRTMFDQFVKRGQETKKEVRVKGKMEEGVETVTLYR